jgi:hypothetical protein
MPTEIVYNSCGERYYAFGVDRSDLRADDTYLGTPLILFVASIASRYPSCSSRLHWNSRDCTTAVIFNYPSTRRASQYSSDDRHLTSVTSDTHAVPQICPKWRTR